MKFLFFKKLSPTSRSTTNGSTSSKSDKITSVSTPTSPGEAAERPDKDKGFSSTRSSSPLLFERVFNKKKQRKRRQSLEKMDVPKSLSLGLHGHGYGSTIVEDYDFDEEDFERSDGSDHDDDDQQGEDPLLVLLRKPTTNRACFPRHNSNTTALTCSTTSATTNRSSILSQGLLMDDHHDHDISHENQRLLSTSNSIPTPSTATKDEMTVTVASARTATTVASTAVSSHSQDYNNGCDIYTVTSTNARNLHPFKQHDFQMVPNPFKELGMIRPDFDTIEQAMQYVRQQQQLQMMPHNLASANASANIPVTLKPILVIDVEVPGNTLLGKTVFSHPLIVEVMETYFVTVASHHRTLPPQNQQQQQQQEIMNTTCCNNAANSNRSKMCGNYAYSRVRILDPITGLDLLMPCLDTQLRRATLLQAMVNAIAMLQPQQQQQQQQQRVLPKYLINFLEEEQAADRAWLRQNRCHELLPMMNNTKTTKTKITTPATASSSSSTNPKNNEKMDRNCTQLQQQKRKQKQETKTSTSSDEQEHQTPMAVFGLEHTALGEVVFAKLDGVLSTQSAWVLQRITPFNEHQQHQHLQEHRQAVIVVRYDSQKLSYASLIKYAIAQHAQGKLGTPVSNLKLYYESHEQQVTAQVHLRQHYRECIEQVDPDNPARHLYGNGSTNGSALPQKTIPIFKLYREGEEDVESYYYSKHCNSHSRSSSTSSSSSSSSQSSTSGPNTTINNSLNNVHPGYKVPNYDKVVKHAAAKAAAEAAARKEATIPTTKHILKTMSADMLELQCSKPALRESHLRFVPLTPQQATKCNHLVFEGKFHLAMQLLSPRQGMILMDALRHAGRKKDSNSSSSSSIVSHTPNQRIPPLIRNATTSHAAPSAKAGDAPLRRVSTSPASSRRTTRPTHMSDTTTRSNSSRQSLKNDKPYFPKQNPRRVSSPAAKKSEVETHSNQASFSAANEQQQQQQQLPSNDNNVVVVNYYDVVDIPILDAWKAFVVFSDDNDNDSLFSSFTDVYSERMTITGNITARDGNGDDDNSTISSSND